jgi:hypothetical protein
MQIYICCFWVENFPQFEYENFSEIFFNEIELGCELLLWTLTLAHLILVEGMLWANPDLQLFTSNG